MSSKELFKIHLDLAEKYNSHLINPVFHETNGGSVKKKLKIGYVSSDFRLHVVAFNVLPLIENHDTEKFTTFLYSNVRNPDHITDKFRSLCDCWRPIEDLSDQAAAKLIEADKIDILIYLAGRFDSNRPEISIYRPAPIQISFHDCATTGLKSIDYWLTDGLLHPQDTQELFVEKLCRLPIFYQYHVLQEAEVDETLPADVKGEITFGCFNKPEKINEEVICLWSKILLHFPNSKLMLKYFNHYSDQIVCNRIKLCFEKYGVAEDRLCFESGYDVRRDHLKYYKRVDICLDPFPFNGATTTFEALSMNVPVIALWGRHFVDRVAATMLTQAGFPELAANDLEEYFLITAQLAADIPRLMNYRKSLRRSLLSSPLCENRTYAKNVENVYLKMWQSLNDAS